MKNKKLKLTEIEVSSFTTIANKEEKQTIIGASISNSTVGRPTGGWNCVKENVRDYWYWVTQT